MTTLCGITLISALFGACLSDPELDAGQSVFDKNCKVCHAQGVNGAPIIGNRKMWAKRAPQGEALLSEHAIQGYGLMPAKGGKDGLPDQDIRLAVRYMMSSLERNQPGTAD